MIEVMAIAEGVWRRILRMKVLYFLIICALIEISVTFMYRYLMAGQHRMLMVDVSLLITTIAGLLCILALAFDIPKEFQLLEGLEKLGCGLPKAGAQDLVGLYERVHSSVLK